MPMTIDPPETKRNGQQGLRVLYSFPFRIGAGQICHTAWQQVAGLDRAGVAVTLVTGSVAKPLPSGVSVITTLSRGPLRIPFRLFGSKRMCRLHDWMVARMLPDLHGKIDIIHGWPLGSLMTIRAAKKLGIPFVIERPNAHTRFAFEVVAQECERLGFRLPPNHEHAYNAKTLEREEAEYEGASALLCPSDFVAQSFLDKGFQESKLLRHRYGYDESRFYPGGETVSRSDRGLTMMYAGACAPRKGLHLALRAWLDSGAAEKGRFIVCGGFVKGYRELLGELLVHPSVEVLGHRNDLGVLMRQSDIFVLSSIEEGSALVTYEARASGCVLLVSDATGAHCRHMENALVHPAGDVDALASHIRLLDQDWNLLIKLRQSSLNGVENLTWTEAGKTLAGAYHKTARTFEVRDLA
jgi:glycosyltransferase involved in cell wall biosynthesis